jgi:RHH-type rel operon transcriptional repressor/antitoxin RelB
MAWISVRVDDELKMRADKKLEKLGVTPAELMRQALQYVIEGGDLPFKTIPALDEDEALLGKVRERFACPERVKILLDSM